MFAKMFLLTFKFLFYSTRNENFAIMNFFQRAPWHSSNFVRGGTVGKLG